VITDFGDHRGVAVLAEVDVLLTSWDCPRIDEAALELLPRLGAVVHAAGSVKEMVADTRVVT
jgi:hypothetical protein